MDPPAAGVVADPEFMGALAAELVAVGADTDTEIIAAAQRMMALVDEAGSASGKYLVDLRGAQGVQVGDHNTQINTFTTPPGS